MLRVLDSVPVEGCHLRVDDYVPLSFRCPDLMSMPPLYWRTGDFDRSLIEIGLNRQTGIICKITVTLIDKLTLMPVLHEAKIEGVIQGAPVCNIADWPTNDFKDEPAQFMTLVGRDYISIWLAPETTLGTKLMAGEVIFGVDEIGSLRLLTFLIRSETDMGRIMKGL